MGPDDPAEMKKGAELIKGYDDLAPVCLLKTTKELKLKGEDTLPVGTSYQWVHPGGWVYKTNKNEYYYTGLTKNGWEATDKSLKISAVHIFNAGGEQKGGGKRRRKTKRKRTKRRKTKHKRSRRKRTMKRRGKTRRRR